MPDILANAGGVTVSYYEWVQNQANEQWEAKEIDAKLQSKMHRAVDAVFSRWQGFVVGDEAAGERDATAVNHERPLEFRTVALIIAIERVAEATLMRGIWP